MSKACCAGCSKKGKFLVKGIVQETVVQDAESAPERQAHVCLCACGTASLCPFLMSWTNNMPARLWDLLLCAHGSVVQVGYS